MNILIFNCGSSSLKYKMIEMPSKKEILFGEAQRINSVTAESSRIIHNNLKKEKKIFFVKMKSHLEAFEEIIKIINKENIVPDVFGHRLVHGGSYFFEPVILSEDILEKLEQIKDLAPIHNPPAINLILACRKSCPDFKQILVFDTAFHSTIPDYAYTYAIPEQLAKNLNIRKYGFHGTSHKYVMKEACCYLNISAGNINAVSCHLGSGGASLCAIKKGVSVDNTMGVSPLQGLVMSTRCGDIDSAVTLNLLRKNDQDVNEIEKLFNNKSGILGLTNSSSDVRDSIPDNYHSSFKTLPRSLQLYIWRIKKYLGAYLAVTYPTNAVIFTDTIGEEIPLVRKLICRCFGYTGLTVDEYKNNNIGQYPADISGKNSKIKVLVIKTNEELEIALNVYKIMVENKKAVK
ncbi:MAG: acetate/propionate family kinase [Spirochaetes bacterium]|nr:acetate/propionate family kinase [Spirochaetota bacterium]